MMFSPWWRISEGFSGQSNQQDSWVSFFHFPDFDDHNFLLQESKKQTKNQNKNQWLPQQQILKDKQ